MNKKRILHIPMMTGYFLEIKSGRKKYEYREMTPRWKKLLEGREYDEIYLKRGYPRKDDFTRIVVRPWRGYEIQTIIHPHFGLYPVTVFAIRVN